MHPIDRFTSTFVRISADTPVDVPTLYAPSIVFADPAHRVEGVEALAAYFARLDANLVEARFEFHEEVRGERSAALRWRMHARLRFPPGRTVDVEGTSWLQHDGTHITAQTDHFDLGALVYEQVPGLGCLLRLLKGLL